MMILAGELALVLLLCLPGLFHPGMQIAMEFNGESEVRARVQVQWNGNLTLVWPVGEDSLLSLGELGTGGSWETGEEELRVRLSGNNSRREFSLDLRFPLEDGKIHVFPVPTCSPGPSINNFEVLLPEGWTTDSDVMKRLEGERERIRLTWENPTVRPEARLLTPGHGGSLWVRFPSAFLLVIVLSFGLLTAFFLLYRGELF